MNRHGDEASGLAITEFERSSGQSMPATPHPLGRVAAQRNPAASSEAPFRLPEAYVRLTACSGPETSLLGQPAHPAAEPRKAFVGSVSERTKRDLGRTGFEALGWGDGGVKHVRAAGGHHVPFVDAFRRRVTPGSGVEHPLSFIGTGFQKKAGVAVKPREAEAGGPRILLRVRAQGQVQCSLQQRQVEVAHRARERNFKQRRGIVRRQGQRAYSDRGVAHGRERECSWSRAPRARTERPRETRQAPARPRGLGWPHSWRLPQSGRHDSGLRARARPRIGATPRLACQGTTDAKE